MICSKHIFVEERMRPRIYSVSRLVFLNKIMEEETSTLLLLSEDSPDIYGGGYNNDFDDDTDVISQIPQHLLDQKFLFMFNEPYKELEFYPALSDEKRKAAVVCDPYEKILEYSETIIYEALSKASSPPFEGTISENGNGTLPIPCFECCAFSQFLNQLRSAGPYKKTKLFLRLNLFSTRCTCNHRLKDTLLTIALKIQEGLTSSHDE